MKIKLDTSDKYLMVAIKIIEILNNNGFQCFVIGGFVRDSLLYIPNDDIDLVTSATTEQIEKLFPTYDIGKNKQMGVSVIKFNDYIFEIATFRKDLYCSLNVRCAESVSITNSLEEDCKRRDFTINSLAMNSNGDIIDFNNGLEDLNNKVIKFIGNGNTRLEEDQIRSLRALRLASKLSFTIDHQTISAIKDNVKNINLIAPERIFQEFQKAASQSGEKVASFILSLWYIGLLKEILPEIDCLNSFEHDKKDHSDGNPFSHTLGALRANENNDYVQNLSILFHDVGKAATHTINERGNHFYGHDNASIPIIDKIAKRLKFPNDLKETILFCAFNHMRMHKFIEMSNNKCLKLIEDKNFEYLLQTAYCDSYSNKIHWSSDYWNLILKKIETLKNSYNNQNSSQSVKKVINGKLVMKLRNITKPDKDVGIIIKKSIDFVVDNNISLNDMNKISDFIVNLEV